MKGEKSDYITLKTKYVLLTLSKIITTNLPWRAFRQLEEIFDCFVFRAKAVRICVHQEGYWLTSSLTLNKGSKLWKFEIRSWKIHTTLFFIAAKLPRNTDERRMKDRRNNLRKKPKHKQSATIHIYIYSNPRGFTFKRNSKCSSISKSRKNIKNASSLIYMVFKSQRVHI